MTLKQWYDSIGDKDSVFDVENPQKFKEATAAILCNILHLDNSKKRDELKEFCTIVRESLSLDDQKVSKIFEDKKSLDKNIYKHTQTIKEQLKDDKYKMLEFMKMLNRFIMVDDCKEEDYCVFEKVKEMLFNPNYAVELSK